MVPMPCKDNQFSQNFHIASASVRLLSVEHTIDDFSAPRLPQLGEINGRKRSNKLIISPSGTISIQ